MYSVNSEKSLVLKMKTGESDRCVTDPRPYMIV